MRLHRIYLRINPIQGLCFNMVPEVSAVETAVLLRAGEVTLLDVRNPDEVMRACIDGALIIALPTLAQRLQEVPRDKPVITVCHHGVRSQRAADVLVAAGFKDVRSMAGGIDAWSQNIDPSLERY